LTLNRTGGPNPHCDATSRFPKYRHPEATACATGSLADLDVASRWIILALLRYSTEKLSGYSRGSQSLSCDHQIVCPCFDGYRLCRMDDISGKLPALIDCANSLVGGIVHWTSRYTYPDVGQILTVETCMTGYCSRCEGRGKIEYHRKRGGLFGGLRRPKTVTENCAVCNGTGVDENVLSLAKTLRAKMSDPATMFSSRQFQEESIKQLSNTAAGVDQLIAIFLQDPFNSIWHSIGVRLAAIGKGDVLLAALQRSGGSWGSYRSDVLNIAKMFAAAGEADGIPLVLQMLPKKYGDIGDGRTPEIYYILKESLEKRACKVSNAILESVLRIPEKVPYSYYAYPSDDRQYGDVNFQSVLQLARDEMSRRQGIKGT
jgi:hypothetical protein